MATTKTITVAPDERGLSQACTFVGEGLKKRRVNDTIASETLKLFEALFHLVVAEVDNDGKLEVGVVSKLGHTDITLMFSGTRFSLPEADPSDGPDAKIIEAYSDKVSCSYEAGDNTVEISVSQSARAFILPNLIAAAAIIVGIVLNLVLDDPAQQQVAEQFV